MRVNFSIGEFKILLLITLFYAIIAFMQVNNKQISFLIFITSLWALPTLASNFRDLSLSALEKDVILESDLLKSKKYDIEAGLAKRKANPSSFIPKFALEGYYKYVTEVPSLSMGPGRELKFGDNENYSLGATMNMVLLDFNSKNELQKSLDSSVLAKKYELQSLTEDLLQKVRFHYINLFLISERQVLLSESHKLAKDQLRDVLKRIKFGSGTKVDRLTANKEVIELKSQFLETQSQMSVELSEIQKLTSSIKQDFLQSPISSKVNSSDFKGHNVIRIDSYEYLLKKFTPFLDKKIETNTHPKVAAINEQSRSLVQQSESIKKGRLPKVSLFARSALDYPNGPIKDEIHQNVVGLSFTMPLFDGGELSHSIQEKRASSESLRALSRAQNTALMGLYALTIEKIRNLKEQSNVLEKKVQESHEIAKLIFQSYMDGRSTFLEVERANIKHRESKQQLALNHYHTLNHLMILAALTGDSYEI